MRAALSILTVAAVAALLPGPAVAAGPDCPAAATTCGWLTVPERRDVAGARTIRVRYAVHRATGPDRRPDPVVFTSGGPGSQSVRLIGRLADVVRDRDVVVLEQRGTRTSEPALRCPELDRALLDALARAGRDAAEAEALTAAGRACRARLDAAGVDLRGYRTRELAADVADLRRELGYPAWNLFGVSYSTRSMLAAAAADPAGTRSVVLDSFLPASTAQYDAGPGDLNAALERLRPGLAAQLERVAVRLDRAPAAARITDPLTGRALTLHLSGGDLAGLLAEGMQDAEFAAVVPPLLQALDDGHDELLDGLGQVAAEALVSHDTGVYYAVDCQDEVPFNAFPPAARDRSFFAAADPAVCRGLALPPGEDASAVTAAPVLVLGGTLDPATPVGRARDVAGRELPGATTVEFAGLSHAVFLGSRCARDSIAAFLDAPSSGGFVPPCDPADSPYRTLGPHSLAVTTLATDPLPAAIPLGLVALVALGLAVAGLWRRRWPVAVAGGGTLALLGAAAGLAYRSVTANPATLLVGIPWPAAVLALAAPVLLPVALLRADRLTRRPHDADGRVRPRRC